jgi:hypothetical protein
MVGSKSTCPKWHFGQLEHGDNWGIFWSIFLVKKPHFLIVNFIETKYKVVPNYTYNIFNMHIHKIKTRGIVNYESIKLNTSQN